MQTIFKLTFSLFGPAGDVTRNERYFTDRKDAERQQEAYERNCRYPHSCTIEKLEVKEGTTPAKTFTDGWYTALWMACETLAQEDCNKQVKHIINKAGLSYEEVLAHRPEEFSFNLKLILEDYYKRFIPN